MRALPARQAHRRLRLSSPNHNVKDLGTACGTNRSCLRFPPSDAALFGGPVVGSGASSRPGFSCQRHFRKPFTPSSGRTFANPHTDLESLQRKAVALEARVVFHCRKIGELRGSLRTWQAQSAEISSAGALPIPGYIRRLKPGLSLGARAGTVRRRADAITRDAAREFQRRGRRRRMRMARNAGAGANPPTGTGDAAAAAMQTKLSEDAERLQNRVFCDILSRTRYRPASTPLPLRPPRFCARPGRRSRPGPQAVRRVSPADAGCGGRSCGQGSSPRSRPAPP